MLLSDTVGFISNLPHHLVASFKSTLEETICAHVLLVVLDVGDRDAPDQFETVRTVLDEIDARSQPRVLVLNKVDTLTDMRQRGLLDGDPLETWMDRVPDAIPVSAKTGEGLDALADRVVELMRGPLLELTLETPMADSRLVDYLEKRTEVLSRDWTETTAVYGVRIGRRQVEQLLARGSVFTLDGIPCTEALERLWPTPEVERDRPVPPHQRVWGDEDTV